MQKDQKSKSKTQGGEKTPPPQSLLSRLVNRTTNRRQ